MKCIQNIFWVYFRLLHFIKWGCNINDQSISEWQKSKTIFGVRVYGTLTKKEIDWLLEKAKQKEPNNGR